MVVVSWNCSIGLMTHINDNDAHPHTFADDIKDKELPDDFLCGLITLY